MQGVLLLHGFIDRHLKCLQRAMQAIGDRQLLEVQPEAFNRIEKRAVFRQPDEQKSVFIQAQSRLRRFTVVVRGVIHDQNEMLTRIVFEQMLKKSDEGITILVKRGEVTHPSTVPVVAPKDMQILRTARRGDQFPLCPFHPTAPQRRMQAHGRFVHKEEFGVGNGVKGDVFFNQSITCVIVS